MGRRPRRPGNPDIEFAARVTARQLRFGEVPRTRTGFAGTPGHDSGSGSDRVNLPDRVATDVTYRRVRVGYWLASALVYPGEARGDRPGAGPPGE
ncbi:MAG: hypothetical protein J2P35_11940 [Actinobacteria bacterium]|nr:hypothetical protein [Actinomycetota bacterium]